MARTKPAEQRRSELLDAAEQLVVRNGSDHFTVDDVTTGAGVAKGTFYLHFAGKAELLDALRTRYAERFAETQRAAAAQAPSTERIEAWLRTGVAEYLRELPLHDALFHHGGQDRTAPNPVISSLAGLLAAHDPPVDDPLATAVLLYSAMHGATDHITAAPEDESRMLDALGRLCRALLPGR